ncbi:MAG: hypothetical protein K0V04_37065 [Deltaproteobacteria bacterium]|nr:hypothetical protein [Deltaproteobacteria bacterium]
MRCSGGTTYELMHGDLVGRLWSAALPIDDARVSEAHAMVSLRERELRLIALRGGLAVEGRPVNEVGLAAGMEILLARGLSITVEGVYLPASVLGLHSPSVMRQVVPPVASLLKAESLRLVAGYAEHASAWIWSSGACWRLTIGRERSRTVKPGDQFEVEGECFDVVAIPLEAAGQAPTRAGGGVDAPLRIRANFDTVHVHRDGAAVLVLSGVQARIVSELVVLGGPTHWTVVAGLVWPNEGHGAVRSRFDVSLSRLRRKLRGARVRTDLVRTDGAGQVELLLYPHDVLEDRT